MEPNQEWPSTTNHPGDDTDEHLSDSPEAEPASLSPEPSTASPDTAAITSAPVPSGRKSRSRPIMVVLALVLVAVGGATALVFTQDFRREEQHETPRQKVVSPVDSDDPLRAVSLDSLSLPLSDNGLSDFDLAFLRLENTEENKIYSPLSIKYVLSMLSDATDGESQAQIGRLLGSYIPRRYLNSKNRNLANALFIKDSFVDHVAGTYIDTVQNNYGAEVIFDAFGSVQPLNTWVSNNTFGQIDPLLPENYSLNMAKFILVNALAIDMEWNYRLGCMSGETRDDNPPCITYDVSYPHEYYDPKFSSDDKTGMGYRHISFNDHENTKAVAVGASINNYDIISALGEANIRATVQAEYEKWLASAETKRAVEDGYADTTFDIDRYIEELGSNYGRIDTSTDFAFHEDDEARVFAKDLQEYDGATLEYIGIMPKAVDLTTYIDHLDAAALTRLVGNLRTADSGQFTDGVVTRVYGTIPLFDFNYELPLKDDLLAIGVTDIFDEEKADLSRLLADELQGVYIDDAIHQANIEFTNRGIKAAAATVAVGGLGAGGVSSFNYWFDVPVEDIDLTFDSPFLFLIRDKASGEVWFMGTVYSGTEVQGPYE